MIIKENNSEKGKKKVYFFPSASKNGYSNPYCKNFKDALKENFYVVDDTRIPKFLNYPLLHYAFTADIFILNWIESIYFTKKGFLKFLLVVISLYIIKTRNAKIIWMLHNIHPHEGNNWTSTFIQKFLFHKSSLIISHSKEGEAYAKEHADCEVIYVCHPIAPIIVCDNVQSISDFDILIWGTILPYKGIVEFISQTIIQKSELKIRIVGKCKDLQLEKEIKSMCGDFISFENRKIDYSELKLLIEKSKYVLFPYLEGSVSSSGALMDTLYLGGFPIGPNIGAFRDLSQEGVCLTYITYQNILEIIQQGKKLNHSRIKEFVDNNSWEHFATQISDKIF